MNLLEEFNEIVSKFYKDCDDFIERLKQYDDKEKQSHLSHNIYHNGRKQKQPAIHLQ